MGASPRGFESRILRHLKGSDLRKRLWTRPARDDVASNIEAASLNSGLSFRPPTDRNRAFRVRACSPPFADVRHRLTNPAAEAGTDLGRFWRSLRLPSEVFIDNRSIRLGRAFTRALEDGVRPSAVFVVLIGPQWDKPPLVDRLANPEDWVRKEILLAQECRATIIPVVVDREEVPAASFLPAVLRFLPELQVGRIRQYDDRDPDVFAEHVADLLRIPAGRVAASAAEGAECTRSALEVLLRRNVAAGRAVDG